VSELRKYGVLLTTEKAIQFTLYQVDGKNIEPAATFAAGDIKISKNGGAEVDTTNLPTDEGSGYSLILTAAELTASRIRLFIVDQTATKVWLDIEVNIETHGHASAMYAFDFDEVMRGTNNAATETKQDIIDANVDTLLTRIVGTLAAGTHNPATAAQIDVLSDWINGARLDLILDIIAADVVNIDGAAMRGTDGANTVAPDNISISAILNDTDITIPGLISALNNLNEAQVNAQADLALVDFFTSIAQLKLDIANGVWSDTLTTYTNGMAGKRVKGLSAATVVEGAINDASATTLSFISNITGYGTDFFIDTEIAVEIAADHWQPRIVTAYNTTTGAFTVDEEFISAPADTSKIALTMRHVHSITAINGEMDTAIADADIATETKQNLIKAKTDSLAFTKLGELDINIQSINDKTITGNGSTEPFDVA